MIRKNLKFVLRNFKHLFREDTWCDNDLFYLKLPLQIIYNITLWNRMTTWNMLPLEKNKNVCCSSSRWLWEVFMAADETLCYWLLDTHPLAVLVQIWMSTDLLKLFKGHIYRVTGTQHRKKYTQHKQQSYQMSVYVMFSVQKRTYRCFYLKIWMLFTYLR